MESLEPRVFLSVSVADAVAVKLNTMFGPNMQFVVTLSEASAAPATVAYQTVSGTAPESEVED
ncbi:MAG: hypothetical protein NNA19_06860 [Nitrospira sp.]|nr:hypothetical protein [Nitrospira sp.]